MNVQYLTAFSEEYWEKIMGIGTYFALTIDIHLDACVQELYELIFSLKRDLLH